MAERTAAVATPSASVGAALRALRRTYGLPDDAGECESWTCRLGRATVRLPNFGWRRKALLAHDLHHVLTGYPCTLRGEFQMAAWEFGAGGMPHWAATAFCLPLVVAGLLWSPRRIWRAFAWGRRSRSLHGSTALADILGMPLDAVRVSHAARPLPGR
jgi:hypothetical protein